MHSPVLVHLWLSQDPSRRTLPAPHAATSFIFKPPLFGIRPPWASPFIKKPLPALLLTHTGRPGPQETLLFTLMMERLITHHSTFQIAGAGSGRKNAIKATASKHGLTGTMMNGLEEACMYSHSIIRCWLADSCQEGHRHSLAGIRPLFSLLGWGLSSCHCHSTLVSISRKQSNAAQRIERPCEVTWGERVEWQWAWNRAPDQLSLDSSVLPPVAMAWGRSWSYSYNWGSVWSSSQRSAGLAWNVCAIISYLWNHKLISKHLQESVFLIVQWRF